MSIQIKKIQTGRKRFIKTLPLNNPNEWLTELALLKQFLGNETSFQLVGHKVYFEMDLNRLEIGPRMMLEVIGVPLELGQKSLELIDFPESEVFVYKMAEADLFSLDFRGLLEKSKMIVHALNENLIKNGTQALPLFHIVYEFEKIELHLFRQKDYIQNQ